MRMFLNLLLAAFLAGGLGNFTRAADDDAGAIIDKGIKALGGEARLSKAKAFSWKSKGTFSFGGNDSEFTGETVAAGSDHFRRQFATDAFQGVTVVDGDKGWRKFGDTKMELDAGALANEKRNLLLAVVAVALVPLKSEGFQVETAGEEKLGDKETTVVKVTAPDGKDFKLFFDKASGLPAKVAAKITGFMGDEVMLESTYDEYKDFDGIQKATKVTSSIDGQKFIEDQVTDFKLLDEVEPATFAEPK